MASCNRRSVTSFKWHLLGWSGCQPPPWGRCIPRWRLARRELPAWPDGSDILTRLRPATCAASSSPASLAAGGRLTGTASVAGTGQRPPAPVRHAVQLQPAGVQRLLQSHQHGTLGTQPQRLAYVLRPHAHPAAFRLENPPDCVGSGPDIRGGSKGFLGKIDGVTALGISNRKSIDLAPHGRKPDDACPQACSWPSRDAARRHAC